MVGINLQKSSLLGSSLNTLAQSGTTSKVKPVKMICGNGTEIGNGEALKGRAKRKIIGQKIAIGFIDIAKKNEDTESIQSYWNTWHCQEKIVNSRGRLYGTYCKNRFCPLCVSIRKADIVNRYLPVIKSWENPHFIVLTVKAVRANKLKVTMESMLKELKKIINKYKKKEQREKGFKLIGIRSLESCFNAETKTYNPHLHLIVANKEMANIIVNEWLERGKKKGRINIKGQFIRRVKNEEKDLMEIIKYSGKIITEVDKAKDSISKDRSKIYLAALNTIFTAMRGHRVFDRFGFNLPTRRDPNSGKFGLVVNYTDMVFDPREFDWVNKETGENLSGFKPELDLINLLSYNIDMTLQ